MDVVSYVKLKAMETLLNGAVNDTVVIPVDVQAHLQQTIATHSGVVLAPSGQSASGWIDTDGFDKIAITGTNSNGSTGAISIYVDWSSDGSTQSGTDGGVSKGGSQIGAFVTETKARYVKINVINDANARTVSINIYLKA